MEAEKKSKYKLSKDDIKFFETFSEEHFGPSFNIEEFLLLLENQSKKLLIDSAIFISHPRVNRYAGKFIKENKLDKLIIEFRSDFKEILGGFKEKLTDEEKTKFNDYWYGKELFRTVIFLLIFTINSNLRTNEGKSMQDYTLKLISQTKLDEYLHKPLLEVFQFLTTFGDIFEFYARSYVDDFEFLYGNYIEPLVPSVKDKDIQLTHRQSKIDCVLNYKDSQYRKMFDSMDSSLRNGLAHKIFYVNEEKNNIKFENYLRELEEINLKDLEHKALHLNVISYMLAISDDYLLKNNNIAIKHIKALAKDMFCKPKDFVGIWNQIIIEISKELERNPKNLLYSLILSRFSNFIFKQVFLLIIQSLELFGLNGISFILQFTFQFYQLFDSELKEIEEKEFIQNMKLSFNSVGIPEDSDLERDVKRFILLVVLKFININPIGVKTLKKLYDSIVS